MSLWPVRVGVGRGQIINGFLVSVPLIVGPVDPEPILWYFPHPRNALSVPHTQPVGESTHCSCPVGRGLLRRRPSGSHWHWATYRTSKTCVVQHSQRKMQRQMLPIKDLKYTDVVIPTICPFSLPIRKQMDLGA